MKTYFSRSLIIGATATLVVLVGGVSSQSIDAPQQPPPGQASPDMQNPVDTSQPVTDVLPPDIAANGPLVEIIRMSQAAVSEEVMNNYVKNSQYKFNLSSGQIIYLKDIGVPDSVVLGMINRDQELGGSVAVPPPQVAQAAPTPPPTTTTVVTEDYFYDSLSPYGTWINVEGYGRCWRPSVVVYDRTWRPYCDGGHWVYTDNGWYWFSDYSWGWAPFHYGRWFFDARFGWCWWPDTVWGPSWVTWRYTDDYCGWAPLPPHCYYREGVGLIYNGVTVSVGFDFGFGAAVFTFVDAHHFCDPHPWRYRCAPTQVTQIYNHTTVNNITVINNGNNNTTVVNGGGHNTTVVNNGIPPEHIATVTHTPIRPVRIRETSTPVGRGEQVNRSGELVVNRPHFDNGAKKGNDNTPHTIPSPTTGAPMQVPPASQIQNANNKRPDTMPRRTESPGQMNGTSPGMVNNPNRQTPTVSPGENNPNRPNIPQRTTPITQTPTANGNDNQPWKQQPSRTAVPAQTDQNAFPHNQPNRPPAWGTPNDDQANQQQRIEQQRAEQQRQAEQQQQLEQQRQAELQRQEQLRQIEQQRQAEQQQQQQPRYVPTQPQPQPQSPNPNRTYNSPRQNPVYVQPAPSQPAYQPPQQPPQDQGQGQGRGRDKDRNDR